MPIVEGTYSKYLSHCECHHSSIMRDLKGRNKKYIGILEESLEKKAKLIGKLKSTSLWVKEIKNQNAEKYLWEHLA